MNKQIHNRTMTGLEIAVIGMAGSFPGAKKIGEFWNNLKNGVESLTFFSNEELKEHGVSGRFLENSNHVKTVGGILEDKELFDAVFFNYTPREAEIMDPQMRVFHQCCWEALEDAGYSTQHYDGAIGLYGGCSSNFYWEGLNLLSGKNREMGNFVSAQLINRDFLTMRVSYKLNLKGPSSFVQATCSTSLVAIHMACRALLTGECKMALAGGVTVSSFPTMGYLYEEGMVLSPDGHCRTFDARAKGTIGGEGVGLVVLKPLNAALKEGDHIYAAIKGSAINNDGNRKAGFSAPSIKGQVEVIRAAQRFARVKPESIHYVETHGTGTSLGDPVEIAALTKAFNTNKRDFCAIGSVKTNIGHLDSAAGVAGFIKTVLSLMHKQIPPSLHFESPNPKINFENTPFYVNTRLSKWKSNGYPLRAAVSSLGIGGTNAHVILEESPEPEESCQSRPYQLISLSARTPQALEMSTQQLARHLKEHPGINLADVAYTLQVGRHVFQYRRKLVCSHVVEAVEGLAGKRKLHTCSPPVENPPVVFMFSGLGSQYVNMGLELYQKEPVFRQELDHCFGVFQAESGYDIKGVMYPSDADKMAEANREIKSMDISQAVVFMFEYALARLLMRWGIQPYAFIGYSFGEYTAACLSGVFSLKDALKLIITRGELLRGLPTGLMLSVPLSVEQLEPLLKEKEKQGEEEELSIAIDNGPSCIVSGATGAVERFEKKMKERRCMCMRLQNAYALHSKMMDPIIEKFQQAVSQIPLTPPEIPYLSNVTGSWLKAAEATNPAYWATHLRTTVRFADGIKQLIEKENIVFIEIGPGRDLCALLVRHMDEKSGHQVVDLIRHREKETSDIYYLLNRVGQLWLYGVKIDWKSFHGEEKRRRIPLPTYPFESQPFRMKANLFDVGLKVLSDEYLLRKKPDMVDWFYVPSWQRSALPFSPLASPTHAAGKVRDRRRWLVFQDESGLGVKLVKRLEEENQEVVTVQPGEGFSQIGVRRYEVNPREFRGYDALFNELEQLGKLPENIVHLWGVDKQWAQDEQGEQHLSLEMLDWSQDIGLYSLLHVVQAVGAHGITHDMEIFVITTNLHEVIGGELVCPAKATLLGAVKIIPLEYPNIKCRSIDVVVSSSTGSTHSREQEEKVLRQLLAEFNSNYHSHDPVSVAAWRGDYRWVQSVQPVQLKRSAQGIQRLKQRGVYLVTGGFGGMGFTLAQYLAKAVQARLILIGRTAIPPKEEWENWLSTHGHQEAVSEKILKVKEMETQGAEVMVFRADVSDLDRMKQIIAQVEDRFGTVDGVLHTAGVIDHSGVIQRRTRTMTESNLAPKVRGTLGLEHVLKHHDLDFLVLFSSVGNQLYGAKFAQVGYNAANEFLDAFAYYKNSKSNTFTVTINWTDWQQVGMAIEANRRHAEINNIEIDDLVPLGVSPAEGVEIFTRILENTFIRVITYIQDLRVTMERTNNPGQQGLPPGKAPDKETAPEVFYQRPELTSDYAAPRNEIEKTLADIWQRYFGIDQVGIHDDFFELKGDSLQATTVASIIHKKMKVRIPLPMFFVRPTIEKLAEYIQETQETARKSIYSSIEPVEEKEFYVLSSSQQRLYILQRLYPQSTSYNQTSAITIANSCKQDKLVRIFQELIHRHESLRTSFELINETPVQRVHGKVEFAIEEVETAESEVAEAMNEFVRPFTLSPAPLLRVGLLKTTGGRLIMIVDLHHIISDGISNGILVNDFLSLYNGEKLLPLRVRYKDFSEWQNRLKESEWMREQEAYWLHEFSAEIPVLNLPVDYARPVVQSFEGSTQGFELGIAETEKLRALALKQGTTLYIVLLAVTNILLSKLSGQEDIIVGTPTAGRRYADLERILGMFVNTLALRNYPTGSKTFTCFLKDLKKRTLDAFENQDYPFEDLVDKVTVNRELSRNPLFDVMFVFQSNSARKSEPIPEPEDSLSNVKQKVNEYENKTAKFDLIFTVCESGSRLPCLLEYSTKLFKGQTIKRFIRYFQVMVFSILREPAQRIFEIDMLPGEEKQEILFDFNHTDAQSPGDKTIQQLFEEQVLKTPGGLAITDADGVEMISYRELNKKANQLAYTIRSKGAKPGYIAGVIINRSIEAITGLIAILKSGGAFLPIDQNYPESRKKFMIEDSAMKLLLTQQHWVDKNSSLLQLFSPETILFIDDESMVSGETSNLKIVTNPKNTAYIIYTSGSTGNPKGVMVEHRSVVNYTWWAIKTYVQNEQVNFPLFTSLSFDLTVTSIFTPLLSGNAIVVYKGDSRESLIGKIIDDNQVGVVKLTPSHLKLIVEQKSNHLDTSGEKVKSGIKRFIVGGEALETALAREIVETFAEAPEIYNEYGPTEATVGCMIYQFNPQGDTRQSVPIGVPADNVGIYLLDKNKKPVPVEVAGELYISGDCLARGYLNRVELTDEKFPDNPFALGKRMYRSGDLARHLSNGNIEFLGRIDQQVKIRGFRIELSEIENKLREYKKHTLISMSTSDLKKIELNNVRRCSKCLLPAHYPGIDFDKDGGCSVCLEYEKYKHEVHRYFKDKEDFYQLIETTKKTNQGNYDCLLFFSGGKDSSYVLYQLIDMGLQVLAFKFDNGYISEIALANIERITSELGVESIICTAENMNSVFVESLNTHYNVCHGCWNALNTMGAKVAHEKGINLVISGLSRGQIYDMRLHGLFQRGIFNEKELEENLLLFRKTFHSKNNKFSRLLDIELAEEAVEKIHFIDFFRYFDIPVLKIRKYLSERGWVRPGDTGCCSSNCIINDVGIYVHLKEKGYHSYAAPLSWDCRLGIMTREEAIREIELKREWQQVDNILKEIGYYDSPIKDVVVIDKVNSSGDKYLSAYIVSEEQLVISELRECLAKELPDYMIPSYFVQIEEIPLTPNGKVDRKALDLPGKQLKSDTTYKAPGNEVEKKIADIWKEVLELDKVGVHDSYFELGGTSFEIIRINTRLKETFQIDIPIVTMFRYVTVSSLAEFINNERKDSNFINSDRMQAMNKGKNKLKNIREKIGGRKNGKEEYTNRV